MTEERARSHPGVLAGTHCCYRNRSKPGGWEVKSKAAMQRAMQRYEQSEKGLARQDRYEQTPKGIKARIRADAKKRGNR